MESINFVSPNIGMNNYDRQLIEDGLSNSNQRENSSLYSFPGILHFLQSEWNKMENERAHWDIEKAELMAKIAFLQGEQKGQECLKEDLVRRIKMLEYAIKEKDQTIKKLQDGSIKANNVSIDSSKNNVDEGSRSKSDSNLRLNADIEKAKAATSEWRESRQRLRRFLQEVGYVDSVLDIRQCRLRNLLPDGIYSKMLENATGINDESLLDAENSAMKNFDFLSQEKEQNIKGDEFCIDGVNLDCKKVEDGSNWTSQFANRFGNMKKNNNIDADDKHDVFKLKDKSIAKFGRSSKKDPELQKFMDQLADSNIQNDDSGISDKDKNKENNIIGASNTNDMDNFTSSFGLGDLASITVTNDVDGDATDASKPFSNASQLPQNSLPITGSSVVENTNEKEKLENLTTGTAQNYWSLKHSLRGHFDSVRCISFYKNESAIISGSDDGTVKVWNFNNHQLSKKGINAEIEAVQTMRGHDGAVLSVEVLNEHVDSTKSSIAISGGIDGTVRLWNLPNLETDPYDFYDSKQNGLCIKEAHCDAVWKVGSIPDEYILFSATPYEIKLWSLVGTNAINNLDETLPSFNGFDMSCQFKKDYQLTTLLSDLPNTNASKNCRITNVSLMKHDHTQMVVSTSTGQLHVIDLSSESVKYSIDLNPSDNNGVVNQDGWSDSGIHCVVSHPTLPLVFCGHDDRYLRTIDLRSNSIVHSMVVHQDAVSCMDIEEYGIYLITGSHDGSLRVWDLEKRSCVQEIASHRAKNNESVHSVSFHSQMPFIGSAGAEGIVKIYS